MYDSYRSGCSYDASESFIFIAKALFSLVYIGFALVYPFIRLYTCLFLNPSIHSFIPSFQFSKSFLRSFFVHFIIFPWPFIYEFILFSFPSVLVLARSCPIVFIPSRTSPVGTLSRHTSLGWSHHGSHFGETYG